MKVLLPLINDIFHGDSNWIAATYYIRNLLNSLAHLSEKEVPEHIILLPETVENDLMLPEFRNNVSWITWKYVPHNLLGLENVPEFDRYLETLNYDVVLNLNNFPSYAFKGSSVSWIPDFQHIRLAENFSSDEIAERDSHFELQAILSDSVLLSSNDSKKDFIKLFPNFEYKAHVYQFASILGQTNLKDDPKKTLEKFNITEDFIYLPNQFWKHKNHLCVFQAWKLLREEGLNIPLILTGAKNDYRFPEYQLELDNFLAEHKLTDIIKYLGFISREEQIQLYRTASFLLQPSLFEGWSTSIEDAKSLGLPIIASDFSVHLEQIPNGTFFVSHDPRDLATKVNSLWRSREKKQTRILSSEYHQNIHSAARSYINAVGSAYQTKELSQVQLRRYSNLIKRRNLAYVRKVESDLKGQISIREKQISNLFESRSYRIGNSILSPLRKVKSFFVKSP